MNKLQILLSQTTQGQIEFLRINASKGSGREVSVQEIIERAINDVAIAVAEAMLENEMNTEPHDGDFLA